MSRFTVPIDDVVIWRRYLHQHPELSFHEEQTANYIKSQLQGMGIPTWRPAPNGIVGTIRGTKPGPDITVALRADHDALPVTEETGEPFSSLVDGVSHSCGHDAHTAMLLGTAKTLVGLTDQFSGTVKLFFQPAEEVLPGGALPMVQGGCMEGVDYVFGTHVMNGPKGTVNVVKGPTTSGSRTAYVRIQGRGSHGAMPHRGVDPVLCAAQVVVALNHIVSRNVDPAAQVVVNPGLLSAGKAPNVVPDTAQIGISIRSYNTEMAAAVYQRVDEVVDGICHAYGCTYQTTWERPYDVVMNDEVLVDQVLASANAVLGEGVATLGKPTVASEDFSEYTKLRPGCFIFLNAGNADDGLPFMNHHPKFNIAEHPTLENGVKVQVQLVLDILGANALGDYAR